MKDFFFSTSPETSAPRELTMTLLRVFAGLAMAFSHGLGKVPPPDQLIQGVSAIGFPAPLVFSWLAALSEFAGGILLAIGLLTRPAAIFLSVTMLVAGFIVHFADPFGTKELSLLYLVIFLLFAVKGSGAWSFDRLVSGKK